MTAERIRTRDCIQEALRMGWVDTRVMLQRDLAHARTVAWEEGVLMREDLGAVTSERASVALKRKSSA